jgi:putative Mn2+ efflux pump MntP
MDYLTTTGIALGLCFDTFAVSLSCGIVQQKIFFRQALRIALVLALFQGGLTVAGYFLGSIVSESLKVIDHWVALGLLSFLGIKMIIEGIKEKELRTETDFTSFKILVTIALGTSIDAFAVGISFAFLEIQIWISGFIIGAVTFLASMIAIRIGKSAGKRLGMRVEIIGGLILIAIGIKIFLEHILG